MLDQVLSFFEIVPDYDLDMMKTDQNLVTLSASILKGLKPVSDEYKPDTVFIQGCLVLKYGYRLKNDLRCF